MYIPDEEKSAEVVEEDEEEDKDLIELPSLDSEVVEEDEETPEDTPEVEPDEKFTTYFEKQTGMPMQEFASTLKEIKAVVAELGADGLKEGIAFIKSSRQAQAIEDVRSEADKMWGVDRTETLKRLEAIKPYFERLPKKDKALYDTVKGADILWRSYVAENGADSTKTKTTKTNSKTSGKRYLYTQSEIDAMSPAEYAKQADKITHAYNNSLVGE